MQTPEAKEELSKRLKELKNKLKFIRTRIYTSSLLMRKFSLGQDRYARQYWVLPSVGGVIIEGVETSLDRTLQPDFHEEEDATLSVERAGGQPVTHKMEQDLKNDSMKGEDNAKKTEVESCQHGCESSARASGCVSGGETDSSVTRPGAAVTDDKVASRRTDQTGSREEMETAPATLSGDDSGCVGLPQQQQSVLAQPSDMDVSGGRTSCMSGVQNSHHQSVQDGSSHGDCSNEHHSSSLGASEEPCDGANTQRKVTREMNATEKSSVAESASSEKGPSLESTHSTASHKHKMSFSTSNVSSSSHMPDWNDKASAHGQLHDKKKVSEERHGEEGAAGIGTKHSNDEQVESLSCQESLEEEDAEKRQATVQVPSSAAADGNGAREKVVTEQQQQQPQQQPTQAHVSGTEGSDPAAPLAVSSSTPAQSSHSSSPWFSLFPRETCEAIQVAYINNQAVLVESSHQRQQQQQQQQQQVQHVLATDAAGHQYIMATPTTAATTATATPQYAYMTPDGQIIPATGQNQVIQQVTGMSYALVGNTLVQVPQTQYIAVNATGQQFVIAGQASATTANQQAAGVQYVALNGGGGSSTAGSASAGGIVQAAGQQGQSQQYVAIVEREGGGQMLVQVGSTEQQGANGAQQYIVQATGDATAATALVAAQARQGSSEGTALSSSSTPQTRYGIVNSDGSITVIDDGVAASYLGVKDSSSKGNVKVMSQAQTLSSNTAVATIGEQQNSSVSLGEERSLEGSQRRVKVEIEVPDQYPQVYIKTEQEEEESSTARQETILGQASLGQGSTSGQTAVVVVEQPASSQKGQQQSSSSSAAVAIKEGIVQGSTTIQTVVDTSTGDSANQVATQVSKMYVCVCVCVRVRVCVCVRACSIHVHLCWQMRVCIFYN